MNILYGPNEGPHGQPPKLTAVERQASARRDAADMERALDIICEALTDWQGMLRQETGPARRAMQALLKGRLAFVEGARLPARAEAPPALV